MSSGPFHGAPRKPPRWTTAFALAGAAWSVARCTLSEDVVARRLPTSSTGGSSGGGAPSPEAGNAAASCDEVPFVSTAASSVQARDTCAGWAARRSFGHALCSCGDVHVSQTLASTATNSAPASEDGPQGSAAVGINGNYALTEYLRVDGSLTIAGKASLSSNGGFDVAGDLRLAMSASAAGPIFVGRDAWLLGATSSLSLVEVGRDLHVAPGATVTSFGPVLVAGTRIEQPFELAPPCACAEGELLDVPGIVADGMLRNDNARIGLTLDALDAPAGAVSLELDCGRFALQRMAGTPPVTLRVNGRVALFVNENVQLGSTFTLELGPGAELDWFVRGTVSLAAGASIGSRARAGAVRLYTIESGDLTLPGTAEVALNLYAPRMNVNVSGLGDVYGALFAASVSAPSTLLLHYDRAVFTADEGCMLPAPATCRRCDDCSAGATCVLGACGACVTDADCCDPLVCVQGRCAPFSGP